MKQQNKTDDNSLLYKYRGAIFTTILVCCLLFAFMGWILFASIKIFIKFFILLGLFSVVIVLIKEQFYEAKFYIKYICYRGVFKSFTIPYTDIYKVKILSHRGELFMILNYHSDNKLKKIKFYSIDSFHFRRIKKILEQKNVRVIDESGLC